MNNQGWIHYWRNSLADADSAKGALKKQDLKNYVRTTTDEFKEGKLKPDSTLLEDLFRNEADTLPNRRTNSSSTGHLLSSESSWERLQRQYAWCTDTNCLLFMGQS